MRKILWPALLFLAGCNFGDPPKGWTFDKPLAQPAPVFHSSESAVSYRIERALRDARVSPAAPAGACDLEGARMFDGAAYASCDANRLRERLLGFGWHPGVVDAVLQESRDQGVDPYLVAAVTSKESGGYARAVSPAGAQGAMQLMPGTARYLGVRDVWNPYENVRGGVTYLKSMYERFADASTALMAYNGGPGLMDAYTTGRVRRLPRETMNFPLDVLRRRDELLQP